MKKVIVLSVLFAFTLHAQNQTPPDSISRAPGENLSTRNTNNLSSASASRSGSNLTFTNRQGEPYTVEQLANELRSLRSAVEQALPMLNAFNETYSNSVAGDQSLTGKLTGLLSDTITRNQGAATNSSGQSSPGFAAVVAALQTLLNTNKSNAGTVPLNPQTLRELPALQAQLESVASTLQKLNVDISSTSTNQNRVLTPTGRSSSRDADSSNP